MTEPIGWASMRSSLHYKTVLPTMPDVGMQVNLHKNLSKRLQPKEMVLFGQTNVDAARKILHRQRVALKLYSGSRLNLKGSTPHETSSRLHGHMLRQQTCADGFLRDGSDNFSNYRSEGSTMLTEASLYGTLPLISAGAERGRGGMSPIPSSAQSVRFGVTDRMTTYDPEKQPDSRGYLVKLKKPIVYKKKYTESEIQNIVKRLTDYDPLTHPAESKGAVRERPSIVTQMPRQSMTNIKKCTAEEVNAIVERLYKFDTSKWPPESRCRIYSGRPKRSMTAPAEVTMSVKPSTPVPPLSARQSLAIDPANQGTKSSPVSQQNSVAISEEDQTSEEHLTEEN